jgi:hypothetical protein
MRDAEQGRARIRDQAESASETELRAQLRGVDAKLEVARLIGDGVVAAFFSADKQKKRIEKLVEFQKAVQSHLGSARWAETVAPFVTDLKAGAHCTTPFHWRVEFPEVFEQLNGGFDAIVGNPPFLGGKSISTNFGNEFSLWLDELHPGGTRSADLVAHFFRRAFFLLRNGGVFGLIATNTIGQGDTRDLGLARILAEGGSVLRATRRLKWPGEAAVVVSVVHVIKGEVARAPVLDGKPARRISAYLVEGDLDDSPARLAANVRKAFVGSYVLGVGFTFDDAAAAKGQAQSLDAMRALIKTNPRNAQRIFPYIGGEEISTDPRHAHHRYAIDFFDRPLRRDPALKSWPDMTDTERAECRVNGIVPGDYPDEVAEDWPELVSILRHLVKPERDTQKRKAIRERWWQYADKRPGLYNAIAPLERVLVTGAAAVMHHMISVSSPNTIYSHKIIVFAQDSWCSFACLQARPHEIWSRCFGTTFGSVDALTYNPTQVFQPFPFPIGFETNTSIEGLGVAYNAFRANLMIERNEGLTKTYNRFHARGENALDITRLRELHTEMDKAVLRAYGWEDLAERAAPEFIEQDNDHDSTSKTRFDWPAEFRDEVLARLLALNAERAAAERSAGLTALLETDEEGNDEETS